MRLHLGLLATYGAPLGCHAGAHGDVGHLRCTTRVPCRCTSGSSSPGAHSEGAVQGHIGHMVTFGAPCSCCAGTHGLPSHFWCTQLHTGLLFNFSLRCTLRVPCRRTWDNSSVWCTLTVPCKCLWGTSPPMAQPQGAMLEHLGHLATYNAPSRCHASAYGAHGAQLHILEGAFGLCGNLHGTMLV